MSTREHLQEAVNRIREDIAQLSRAAGPTRAYEWMRTSTWERIAQLERTAADLEARIAALAPDNSD